MINQSSGKNFLGHKNPLPDSFKNFDNVSGHFATSPVKETDVNFSIMRNPIDLSLSYIKYMHDRFYAQETFDELFNHYVDTNKIEHFCNINMKFLTGRINKDKYNQNFHDLRNVAESGWYIEDYSNNVSQSIDIINNNKTQVFIFGDKSIYNTISSLYGISYNNVIINQSSKIDVLDSYKYRSKLYKMNLLDLELYDFFESNI